MMNALPLVPEGIRRDTPIPLHYQLTEMLSQEIESGHWKIGERIPTEEELCERFSLSRTTVRRALEALVNQGQLSREKGRGTFVAAPKLIEGLINRPVGFFEDMMAQGVEVITRILEMRTMNASRAIAGVLHIEPGRAVVKLDRLRLIDGIPILIVTSYLPADLCPELLPEDIEHQGLYTILSEKYGFKIVHARRYIEAVAANRYEADLLEVPLATPLLHIESTVFLENGQIIEFFRARHRGDRTRLIAETFGYDGEGIHPTH